MSRDYWSSSRPALSFQTHALASATGSVVARRQSAGVPAAHQRVADGGLAAESHAWSWSGAVARANYSGSAS